MKNFFVLLKEKLILKESSAGHSFRGAAYHKNNFYGTDE
jgi:hypothetical protein